MRRLLQIVLLLFVILAVIGGRYLYHKGLTRSWREWLVEAVRKRGVEVSFGRVTVRPFRGLVAKDVRIYDSPARNRVLARMNEMVVEANYAKAVNGEDFLDALTLVDSSLRIPLDPTQPYGPAVDVSNLNARILFPPNQIHVSRMEADVFGIHVRAGGNLTVSAASSKFPDTFRANDGLMGSVLRQLGRIRYDGRAPSLNIRFSGDTSHPAGILVEAEFAGEKIRFDQYLLASVSVSACWQNNVLLLSRFDAADPVGRFQASGSFDPRWRSADLRVRSGLDLPAFARALGLADWGDISFQSVPQIDLTAHADFSEVRGRPGPAFKAVGQATVGKFTYRKVQFQKLTAGFAWEGRRWAVREMVLKHATGGELSGDIQQDYNAEGVGDFRAGFASTLRPELLAPILPVEARARLALVKWTESPRITLSARGPSPGIDTLSVAGELRVKGASYRGVEARSAEARFRYKDRVLSVDSFEISRAEGAVSGGLVFDIRNDTVQVQRVRASVHPAEVTLWVDPAILPEVKPYRFGRKPPSLVIDGIFDRRKNGTRTRLNVVVDAPGGFDYTFLGKELRFGETRGKLFFTDDNLRLSDTRAELFGGTVTGEADISILKAKPGHTASIRLAGVNFAKLSKLYFDYDDSEGKLDGSYNFTGRGDDGRTMRGEGEVTVTEGNVFAIPFLGPFSEILDKIIPGLGYNRAHKASMSFGVADGVISTKNFVVTGKGFSMIGDGRIWFLDDRMDFDIRINAQGIPGVLLFPVSKLFEYRASSKFSKPEWRPKVIPRAGGERSP